MKQTGCITKFQQEACHWVIAVVTANEKPIHHGDGDSQNLDGILPVDAMEASLLNAQTKTSAERDLYKHYSWHYCTGKLHVFPLSTALV
jgi:hypothetical protein